MIARGRESRVIMIAPAGFGEEVSGIGRYVEMLSVGLRDRGVNVTLIVPGAGRHRLPLPDGIECVSIDTSVSVEDAWLLAVQEFNARAVEEVLRLCGDVGKAPKQVVHLHGASVGFAAEALVTLKWPPVCFTLHGLDWEHVSQPTEASESVRRATICAIAQLPMILCSSEYLRSRVSDLGVVAGTVTTVTPGVRSALRSRRPTTSPRRPRELLFVGRFERDKDPLLAVRAMVTANMAFGGCRLTLVGSGSMRSEVLVRAEVWGVGDRIVFVDDCNDEHLKCLYQESGVLLVPSVVESYSMVAAEASYFGCPIVAFDAGGIAEAARPELLHLVPSGDSRRFTRTAADVVRMTLEYGDGRELVGGDYAPRTGEEMANDMLGVYNRLGWGGEPLMRGRDSAPQQ